VVQPRQDWDCDNGTGLLDLSVPNTGIAEQRALACTSEGGARAKPGAVPRSGCGSMGLKAKNNDIGYGRCPAQPV
jgi:hypothetical protein